MAHCITTEVNENRTTANETTGTRHFTTVTERQEWSGGKYDGKTYRITTRYVGNEPGYRHIMLGRTSEPWL